MSKRLAWHGMVVLAAVLAVPGSSVGFPAEPLDLVVKIDDHAGVPSSVMSKAKAEAEVIFGAAGVRIGWDANEESAGLRLLVVKLESVAGSRTSTVVGMAARHSRRAFVFYDRLLGVAGRQPIDTAVVLGRIMAHELGHLLLPPGPHARFGVMRGHIELAAGSPDRFSAAEARQLRSAVAAAPELTIASSRAGR